MPTGTETLTLWAAERLLTGSLQGGLVIAAVWLVCRRLRSIRPSVVAALWWVASAKLVLAFLPVPALPIPVLPAEVYADVDRATDAMGGIGAEAGLQPGPDGGPLTTPTAGGRPSPWLVGAIALWLVAVAVQSWRLILVLRGLQGVIRRSRPLDGQDATVARVAAAVGLTAVPDVRMSDEIDAPQVIGVRRPTVLLPARFTIALSEDDRLMALCHELVHVRRHDLALGWVPALAERLFFFHPLARLAAREYVVAREAACDAAVVRALDVTPGDYGRLLVRLGVAGADAVLAASGSSSSISSLKRRLDMLHYVTSTGVSRPVAWSLALLMVLALVPLQLVARTQSPPPAPSATVVAPAPIPVAPVSPVVPAPTSRPLAIPPRAIVRAPRVAQPASAPRPNRLAPPRPAPFAGAASPALPQLPAVLAPLEAPPVRDELLQLRTVIEAVRQKQLGWGLLDEALEEERKKALALDRLRRELDTLRRSLESRQDALAPQPAPLAQQLVQLGREEEALNQQQQELARQQASVAARQRAIWEESARIRAALERASAEAAAAPEK